MSAFTTREIEYLESQSMGRLATVGPDGRPHIVPLTYRYNPDEDTIDLGGIDFANTKKWRDAQANPGPRSWSTTSRRPPPRWRCGATPRSTRPAARRSTPGSPSSCPSSSASAPRRELGPGGGHRPDRGGLRRLPRRGLSTVDLLDTLRSTGAVREFAPDPVPDEVLARVLDTARFAPSGGNRQGWRVVVVRDEDTRRRLRDLYLDGWYDYLAIMLAGLTPWAPVTDRAAEASALAGAHRLAAGPGGGRGRLRGAARPGAGAAGPVRRPAGPRRGRPRPRPLHLRRRGLDLSFAWNLLLAARAEGLGGVITTMPVRREEAVKSLLRAPDELALAAVVALGHAKGRRPPDLRRAPVASFTTVDRIDGPAFGG